jgi:LuxR family maltose regulon positive regulatory protein
MLDPLLRTKLFIPPVRPNLVPRSHLTEQINQGLQLGHKLTLISAPAGFGKSTLLSEWVVANDRPVAWISLDEGDNDPTRFLTYLVTALQTLALSEVEGIAAGQSPDGQFGERVLALLQSPQPPPTESILTILLNEIASARDNFVLVLDDYHAIESSLVDVSTSVDEALAFLLERLPPQMHLVIATREDPRLPLARLRARGQLTELRVSDLRFTPSEAADFLNRVMGLSLSAVEIDALESRTEGWIAGLQLAALSMRQHQDATSFIQSFTGSHHFVLDYLLEEVLHQQPPHIQTFLLQSAILDRMTGSLCDAVRFGMAERSGSVEGTAVSGQENGQAILEMLEHANLFIVPLDNERRWYRYHHLFADLLYQRLRQTHREQIPTLHGRASEWYEQSGQQADAVRHALVAKDFERVANLAELTWQAMDDSFQSTTWLGWVRELPDELIRNRPVLSTQYAWALWLNGDLEASEARLQDAERWLGPLGEMSARPESSTEGMVVVDEAQFQTLPATIVLARSYNTLAQGDVSGAVKHAELARKLTPEEDHVGQANAIVSLGFAHWSSGDLEAAHRALADWISSVQKAGTIIFVIASTFALADIMVAQGLLREAVSAYKHALQLASEQDEHVQRVIAHLYLGLAMLYHEMGDREVAAQYLLKSRESGELSTLPDWPSRWAIARAQLNESRGDLETALDLLDEANRLTVRNTLPDIHPIEALKARVYVRQGRLAKAQAWVNEQGLSVDDELSYLREFEHMTLARVLIAEYKSNLVEPSIVQATGLLERLLEAAEGKRRMGSVIEILVLQALTYQAQDDMALAFAALERALALAEPEGYFRIFLDEGAPMAAMLERLKTGDEVIKKYARKLLDAFDDKEFHPSALTSQPLVDPLSKREREVLELLTTELTGPEIARELTISMNTLRTHTKNIYSKLGVNSRRDAVKQARERKLI